MASGRNGFFYIFELKMASFCALWELIFIEVELPVKTHKPVSLNFGL